MFQFRLANGIRGAITSGSLGVYNHYLAIRPDALLTRPLWIQRACRSHPGFNIISGDRVRPMHFHIRDWDLALLACTPSAMLLWLQPYLDNNASTRCFRGTAPPPQPEGFNGTWTTMDTGPLHGRARYECAAVQLFRRHTTRLGNLDDISTFATLPEWRWPHLEDPCGSVDVSERAVNRTTRNRTRNSPFRTLYG